jgi:hypothetical protein
LNLCDFQSSSSNLQRSLYNFQAMTSTNENNDSTSSLTDEQLPQTVSRSVTPINHNDPLNNDRLVFLRYITGVILFDQKLYLDALSTIVNVPNILDKLPFQIYRYEK